ncbi:hydroxyproline-2-epimerase [Pseudoroseomonas deserti]|uniref:Hydroxyproline-2-epimerase n=1 Tax=Teichococcus deserti TaxID=1817963 RepID=A0A1V2GUT3_9PROT|nr:4-hydroxyproline epimerase [Pseudoroseomonas deserti]ONG44692.1 hydroxyproline-2-epimerase [Pseudoroseomonas deserti]
MEGVATPVPPGNHSFACIDGHTCGNPVRLVTGGAPFLQGASMSEKRQDFLQHHDWIRRSLMFEPRGHSVMSGSILYPPTTPDGDVAVLFIEVSGCLPMCGHGTIGTVTMALENGLARPAKEGVLNLDVPAGRVVATYERNGEHIDSVRIRNIASYLALPDVEVEMPGFGRLRVDISYGGNFYAIVEPQPGFAGLESLSADDVLRFSPELRRRLNAIVEVAHPDDPTIRGVSHVMWTGAPRDPRAHARNAVFYGDRAIDRSPCGTGTSARMAQLAARGKLAVGQEFIHESIIGTMFDGRVEAAACIGNHDAIIPSIAGWARTHGLNTIFVRERDPLRAGFLV